MPDDRTLKDALEQAKETLNTLELTRARIESEISIVRAEIQGLDLALARAQRADLPVPAIQPTARAKSPGGYFVDIHNDVAPALLLQGGEGASWLSAESFDPDDPSSVMAAGFVSIGMLVAFLIGKYQDWQRDKKATAVARVLREAQVPVHRSTIFDALTRLGRTDTLADVSAALAYLKGKGTVEPVGDGYWAWKDGSASTIEAASSEVTSG